MRVTGSALKRGYTEADIRHALRYAVRVVPDQGYVDMYIGPAPDGTMLEVGVTWDDDPRIIHAMKARSKYWPIRKGQRR